MFKAAVLASFAALALSAAGNVNATVNIKVDQVGYQPAARKLAMVTASAASFQVKHADSNAVVFEGKLGAPENEPDSGDTVRHADFTALKSPGTYYVDVPGVGRSWPFAIRKDVLTNVYYLTMRAFYGQRCNTAVGLGPQFPGYSYAACHLEQQFHASSGKHGPSHTRGGWHDAGDYGRYVVNSGITTGTLLWAWEMYGPKVKKIRLDIPESGQPAPDILSEIRWNLEWMLGMQDEDGGAWHKQTTERFSGFVMPQDDKMPSVVIGAGKPPYKSTCATADLAAVAAIAARVYPPYDRAFAARALQAARRAWTWTGENPNVLFHNPPGVNTGAYGDSNCADERLWAAAELWRTTGAREYNGYFVDHYAEFRQMVQRPHAEGWAQLSPLAWWTYALAKRKGADPKVLADVRQEAAASARRLAESTLRHPYRLSLVANDYVWGSNGVVANAAMQLLVANAISPDPVFIEAARDNLHYLFGRNTFSLSFVTQLGANPYRHPHHRPSGADQNPEPWPGMLSGGPNKNRQDAVTRALPPQMPPARIYVDAEASYASNEIAINWQAPLVFTVAGLLE